MKAAHLLRRCGYEDGGAVEDKSKQPATPTAAPKSGPVPDGKSDGGFLKGVGDAMGFFFTKSKPDNKFAGSRRRGGRT